jgi:hypothetical protein
MLRCNNTDIGFREPGTIAIMKTFDQNLIWKCYAETLEHGDLDTVSKALGLTPSEFKQLLESNEAFRNANASANAKRGLGVIEDFIDPETKMQWALICGCDQDLQQEALLNLATNGDRARQRMFLHAVVESRFNVPKVCKLLGIGKKTLDTWTRTSPEFRELLESINWAKREFVEAKLMELVDTGSERATIEANKSLNREVYGDVTRVEGTIDHRHAVALIDVTALKLNLETRVQLLEAVRDAGLIDADGLFLESGEPVSQ